MATNGEQPLTDYFIRLSEPGFEAELQAFYDDPAGQLVSNGVTEELANEIAAHIQRIRDLVYAEHGSTETAMQRILVNVRIIVTRLEQT